MKKCKFDTCDNNVFGGLYCRNHQYMRTDKKDKPIKRTPINRDYKPTGEGALFDSIISTRRPISFISGLNIKDIDGIINHNNCHHVLNKKDYEKFRLYDRNIILITKYEHHLIHNGTEEQREKYVKDVMSEYGVVVHWEKLEELKQILINDYKKRAVEKILCDYLSLFKK